MTLVKHLLHRLVQALANIAIQFVTEWLVTNTSDAVASKGQFQPSPEAVVMVTCEILFRHYKTFL